MHRWRWTIVGAVVLTAAAGSVYWVSVPTEFNVVRGNRSFFDSDGEFITRQFRQGRTFTHNDHLLYHLAARAFHDGAAERLPARRDAVRVHKLLSVGAGALGLGLLFVIGYQWLGHWLALLPALLVGGSAGYWFFASTIDTYLPSLCASIAALGLALQCVRSQRSANYVWLGVCIGLAFLLRTDAVLLAPLLLVSLGAGRAIPMRLGACVLTAVLIGGGGYAALAHRYYDVPLNDLSGWMLNHRNRPEAEQGAWGNTANLTPENLETVLANHLAYTVLLPGLRTTNDADIVRVSGGSRWVLRPRVSLDT